jgi:DNA helicase MCM9
LIDSCKAGDDITVVGMLRKRWRPLQRAMRPDAELAIDALHVRVNNEERGAARVSKEAVLEFEQFWRGYVANPLKVHCRALRVEERLGNAPPVSV